MVLFDIFITSISIYSLFAVAPPFEAFIYWLGVIYLSFYL